MFKRNRLRIAYHHKVKMTKGIHLLLVTTLLLSIFFPAAGQAHAAEANHTMHQENQCKAPDRTTGGQTTIFLPYIGSFVQSAKAYVMGEDVEAIQSVESPINSYDIKFLSQVAAARSLNYEVGKTYVYLYDYVVEAKNFGRTREGTQTSNGQLMRINAYVDMTILSKDSSGTISAEVSMRDPFICTTENLENQNVLEDKATIDALAQPMRFDQASNGAISNIAVLPDSPTLVKNLQKGIINFLQVTIDPAGTQYAAAEQGIQGIYNAQYELEEKVDGVHLTKKVSQNDFSQMQTLGEQPESFEMGLTYDIVMGNDKQVLTSVALTEKSATADGSKDPATNGSNGMDGLSVWSTADATGNMTLETVQDAPAGRNNRAVTALYQVDTIIGDLSEEATQYNGIDLDQVDLEAEFDTFEADPENPDHFVRIMTLSEAQGGEAVVHEIGERMASHVGNPALMNDYIDMLGEIGTPLAQDYLNGIFNNSTTRSANIFASTSITSQEQALINMAVLTEPVTQTVGTLKQLSGEQNSELKSTAKLVLSAAADELDDDELIAEILAELQAELDQAADVDEAIEILYAIGNLGAEASLPTLTQYISSTIEINGVTLTDTLDILDLNATAYEAMVDIPGFVAEDLLLDALEDDNLDDWVWEIVVDVLLDRDIYEDTALSEEAVAILEEFLGDWYDEEEAGLPRGPDAVHGEIQRNWNWAMGGEKAGVRMPGSLVVASPPESDKYGGGMYLLAQQQVNAYVWQVTDNFNVASAYVKSAKEGEKQRFESKVTLLNNTITAVDYNELVSCNGEIQKRILNKYVEVFRATLVFFTPVGITLNFEISAGGQITLDLIAGANVCAGSTPSITGGIAPGAAISVVGRVYISVLFVARAGGEIQGYLMHTSIPITATVGLLDTDPGVQVCLDVKTVTRPFSVDFKVFAEYFSITKATYKRVLSITVFSYSVDQTWEVPLLNWCTPEPNGSERMLDAVYGGVNFFTTVPDASCGTKYPGFVAGRQLLNNNWSPENSNYQTLSMCRGTAFPSASITYLMENNLNKCPTGSEKLGWIQPGAFADLGNTYKFNGIGMTLCQMQDTSIPLPETARFYITPNLGVCRAGDDVAGQIYLGNFSTAQPQWDHFGITVCARD
ncbi:MAG: hypothetical protein AAF902_12845 [Chloroflexota bacterium]